MSKCKELSGNGRKRRHSYDDPKQPNKCSKCQHVTKHGARFEKANN